MDVELSNSVQAVLPKTKSLVSVIIPIYNVEKYLKKCVDSILSQTYSNLEVILVNDGSSDNSREICDTYAEQDNRIRAIHQKNCGVSSARNNGIKTAQGEYITFVDADDWLEPDAIKTMTNLMNQFKTDLVRTRCNIVMGDVKKIRKERIGTGLYEGESLKKLQYAAAKGDIYCYSWLLIVKTDLLKRHGIGFPVGIPMMEDTWFYHDILRAVDSAYISDNVTYNYIINPQGASRSLNGFSEKIDSVLKVNNHIVNDIFTREQRNVINAIDMNIITSMVMAHVDKANFRNIKKLLHIVSNKKAVRSLYASSDASKLNAYQRLASWSTINNLVSIIICLKIIRKIAGK